MANQFVRNDIINHAPDVWICAWSPSALLDLMS